MVTISPTETQIIITAASLDDVIMIQQGMLTLLRSLSSEWNGDRHSTALQAVCEVLEATLLTEDQSALLQKAIRDRVEQPRRAA